MWLLLAFIAVPLIEIALFIQVGGLIGLWPTLGTVILTALAGTMLLRHQGLSELGKLRAALSGSGDPSGPLVHGAMILFAGALLLTPGFFTDAVGFALLLPPVRAHIFMQIRKRIVLHDMHQPRRGPDIIEGDYQTIRPDRNDPSGWTRH
ncbi:FxsA family protein [Roseovarius autotrophicus]|uniref:FxsA family protein n=1 Tax=Roseovarius autotrophicus TaxID=2824121 RepID=UPI001A02E9F2|nr:FxsA family protein [Roseovarius autotrophicus]MBE0453426.1 FxsA family protein [Roseovarius sp.]